jgi:hypothetical protein
MRRGRGLTKKWPRCDKKGLIAWVGGAGWPWGEVTRRGLGSVGGRAIPDEVGLLLTGNTIPDRWTPWGTYTLVPVPLSV